MQRKPIISVTVATYNRAHLLTRAINSVLSQTYQDFELIIVDDCSTDNTQEVVKSFKDNRIVYHRHEKNKGYLAARNTGWNLAQGKYNCQLGDDDELLPNALETVVTKFKELSAKGAKFIWFDIINAESDTRGGSGLVKEGYITYEDVLSGKVHGDYWQAVDIDFLDNYRFDEKWYGAPVGDGILWLKLLRKTKGHYVPAVLYKAYRKHGGERECRKRLNLTKHLLGLHSYEKTFLEENGEELKRLYPEMYGRKLNELGFYQILNCEKVNGRKTLFTSFKYNFSIKHCVLFMLSFIMSGDKIKIFYMKLFNME